MRLIPAPQSITNSRMRNRILLLLACCLGLYGGVSCTTRKAPSSSPQPPPGQTAADAKAEKEKQAAEAKAKKERQAAEAKAKKDKEAAAKAAKLHPGTDSSTNAAVSSTNAPGPALNPNAPLTKEQKLNDLNRRYKNDEISSPDYQTERAKILAEP